MSEKEWIFTEDQRDDVCKGKLCPKCLSSDIKYAGCAPDFMNTNNGWNCQKCGEKWEGY